VELWGSISKNDHRNVIILGLQNDQLTDFRIEQLKQYLQKMAKLLPNFTRAEIQVDYALNKFYEENDLRWLPDCFSHFVDYYHLISPKAYKSYYTKEDLLLVPAHSVKELENGWIEIISYADPLSYDQPQTRERIIEMTGYLNAHRLDRKKVAAGV
jgi:hypothetical protein